MSDFNPSPYRGDGNIGHVSEDLFKMYFVGSNVSTSDAVNLWGCWVAWSTFSALLPVIAVSFVDGIVARQRPG